MQYFFDGEINREWPETGLLLDNQPIRVRRMVVKTWMEYLVPSKVGEPKFEYITQGRSLLAKKAGDYFSTCGELGMIVLYVIGYRGSILNRNLRAGDGGPKQYMPGANMSRLMGHLGGPSKREGAWVPWGGEKGTLPQLGDIICVTEGPPRSEHVMVTMDHLQLDSDVYVDGLYVAEAGRGYIVDQHCGFGAKELVGKKVGGRTCVGFVNIGKLKLTQPAILPPDSEKLLRA